MSSRTSAPPAGGATGRGGSRAKRPPDPGELEADLRVIRDRLLSELGKARGSGAANVARELRIVAEKIAEIGPKKTEVIDEISERRAKRRAAASRS